MRWPLPERGETATVAGGVIVWHRDPAHAALVADVRERLAEMAAAAAAAAQVPGGLRGP